MALFTPVLTGFRCGGGDGRLTSSSPIGHMKRLIIIFWLLAILLGALQAWNARNAMNPDGISYLDMGDAFLRGDWSMAINAYWSPLYSSLLGLAMLVLKPSPYWEFSVVHLVNFVIYLCTLACFHFFLLELIRYQRNRSAESSGKGALTLPEWAWFSLGYALFIWSSLSLITIRGVSPDMCVAGIVYLASGILLRIHMGSTHWLMFVLLSVVLGFGYLAKAAMFPLAFIFLVIAMLSVDNLRKGIGRGLIGLVIFLVIAAPFIIALSQTKGRLTFGDSAKLAYAWLVNGIPTYAHWQGEPRANGIPKHPTKKLLDVPAIYEFGDLIRGTYPPWYDPSYWHEGLTLGFNLKSQLKPLMAGAKAHFNIFFGLQVGLITGFLILFMMSGRGWGCVRDIAQHWRLITIAIAAFGMYSLVHVESRFLGAFVVLLWAGIGSAVYMPNSQESTRLLSSVSITMLIIMMIATGALIAYDMIDNRPEKLDSSTHIHWQVADGLKRIGVQPGDKVAFIGDSFRAYWARLARVQIIAEIPQQDVNDYWAAAQIVKAQVINAFADTGAKIVVVKNVPIPASIAGWQRIGKTDYYALILPTIASRLKNDK